MQACHASREAGLEENKKFAQTSSIVLIQIPNEKELIQEMEYIQSLGIPCSSFYEPYEDTGITSFSTHAIGQELRHHFENYTLWGRPMGDEKTPLTQYLSEEKKHFQKIRSQKKKAMKQNSLSESSFEKNLTLMEN